MKKINSISGTLVVLDAADLRQINGGTAKEGFDAGYKIGEFCRSLWDGWKVLKFLMAL